MNNPKLTLSAIAPKLQLCPIWQTPCEVVDHYVENPGEANQDFICVVSSERTGGSYGMPFAMASSVRGLPAEQAAVLTTWLVRQREMGNYHPVVRRKLLTKVSTKVVKPLRPYEKADRLLVALTNKFPDRGTQFSQRDVIDDLIMLALTESTNRREASLLIEHLATGGYLYTEPGTCYITAVGYERLADLETSNNDSMQIFVAMWFDESVNCIYADAIKGAIEDAGYIPYRVDKPPNANKETYENKICDRIEVEIRKSRMLVADFTHGDSGARGGVYYEAGLARGLGIPVIWTCRKDMLSGNKLHFDTRQYSHIDWTLDELPKFKQELIDRITIMAQTT